MNDSTKDALTSQGQFLVYAAEDGQVKIDVRLENETVWLTQKLMAKLFQTTPSNINIHLKNIFDEGELSRDSVIKESLITAADGKKYQTLFYNLDAIISVGYRVKSSVANRFRIWATQRLREYIVKGYEELIRRIPMHMKDWIAKLHVFLTINDRDILTHAGMISHEMAKGAGRG
jgi:hypothetical protein